MIVRSIQVALTPAQLERVLDLCDQERAGLLDLQHVEGHRSHAGDIALLSRISNVLSKAKATTKPVTRPGEVPPTAMMLMSPHATKVAIHAVAQGPGGRSLCANFDTSMWATRGDWDPEKVTCTRCRRALALVPIAKLQLQPGTLYTSNDHASSKHEP